jgi:hypothetical protein
VISGQYELGIYILASEVVTAIQLSLGCYIVALGCLEQGCHSLALAHTFSGEHITSILKVEEQAKQQNSRSSLQDELVCFLGNPFTLKMEGVCNLKCQPLSELHSFRSQKTTVAVIMFTNYFLFQAASILWNW